LTDRYLHGIPAGSRAAKPTGFLKTAEVDEAHISKARALQDLARERGQSLAQMALAWVLRDGVIASVLIGASSVEQVEQNVAALQKLGFSAEELAKIERILG
jgi:L-glyceraldehyde 3-phosphate reductase